MLQKTLLETGRLPLAEVARLTRKEGQRTRDIYRVHRWFARRLSTQFRSILAALTLSSEQEELFWSRYHSHIPLDNYVVLDPFVGGGTSVVEASRCGALVIGYDIDPVATTITRFELAARHYQDAPERAEAVTADLAERIRSFHRTTLSDGTIAEVLHHFWTEVTMCSRCQSPFELHPHYQLAYDKSKEIQWAFCQYCHEIQKLRLSQKRLHCYCNGEKRTTIKAGTLKLGTVTCPHCGHSRALSEGDKSKPPHWRLFAQEYLVPQQHAPLRLFKRASDSDRELYDKADEELNEIVSEYGPIAPKRLIPKEGRQDRRPILHGIRRYPELFNKRQLLHLTLLGHRIRAVEDEELKQFLVLAFSEHLTANCMYTGYAYGYRRTSPLFSFHGYRHIVRPVEINPWLDGIGRSTFPNVVRKIGKAIAYAQAPTDLGNQQETFPVGPSDGRVSTNPREVLEGQYQAAIKTQSSTDLSDIPDHSVHLILTDPPYFDNVSYSELSDFYLAWQQQIQDLEPPYNNSMIAAPITQNLAVTERSVTAFNEYKDELAVVLRECHRVLHPDGICVFTYHHNSEEAWLLLGQALALSGLECSAVLPMRGEGQGGLHTKSGTIKWDAVIVCRKGGRRAMKDSELYVTMKTIREARVTLARYKELLDKEPGVAFREPDQINFLRALLVTKGMPQYEVRGKDSVALSVALTLPFS